MFRSKQTLSPPLTRFTVCCVTVCCAFVAIAALPAQQPDQPQPLQVYILAGQSNMEGKAKMSLVDYQAQAEEHRDAYASLRDGDQWRVRDDVWIRFHQRHGPLTVGYGSPDCIGPELQFGFAIGDHHEQPVLLIKTAWGGRSLYQDFRPPSAGLPPDDVLQAMLEQKNKNRDEPLTMDEVQSTFGQAYREMLAEIEDTLAQLDTYAPGAAGREWQLAGLVWFQGWNDMINDQYTAEYAENMAHFIRDVRRDLNSPDLPVVIGQMGVDGMNANPKLETFKSAQAEPASLPEFQGNVAVVETDQYWDTAAEEVFKRGWKENIDQWNRVGSDYPYHYLGSGKTMLRIGNAFAAAMVQLQSTAGRQSSCDR